MAIHDIIWQNIKCDETLKFCKRFISIFALIALFFVLSVPSVDPVHQAFIQFLKSSSSFGNEFFSLSFVDTESKSLDYIVKEYMPALWVVMVNTFNLIIVYRLGIFRQQTEFVYFHSFIFRVICFYMHFNMIFMPMLGYGSNDSSWSLIAYLFAWRKTKSEFIFGTSCKP